MIERVNQWDRQISISIAMLTVFAALLGYLQITAGNLNNQYRAESSRYAVDAMRLRSTGEARSSFEAGHMLRLAELITQQRALAQSNEDTATVQKLDAIAQSLKSLSPVLNDPYASMKDGAVERYEVDAYLVDAVRAEQMRAAVTALDQAWDAKANTYVVHLTLIAVVLALLGLSQAMANVPRLMVLVVSALMTLLTIGWTARTYLQPLPVLSKPAIDMYATAYGAAYQSHREEALKGYDEALNQLPTYADAHYERAMTLWLLDSNEEALLALSSARENGYDAASVDSMESYLLLTVGRVADAEVSAQKWVEREPENRDALGALLAAQIAHDQLEPAQESVEIKNVKLSEGTVAAARDMVRALRSQAMRAAFALTSEPVGAMSEIVVGTLDESEAFAAMDKIASTVQSIALQMKTDSVPADAHILVRIYQDGFENQALRYVTKWDGEPTGMKVLSVPIDIGAAYVLQTGMYEVEMYVNGVMQGERVRFEVTE
ncbi:MAG: hypothetical protein NTZ50_14095 [Chloroflexi bacterium]|nr:hypothetical protein [Chloroflexota bacterium]